MTPCAGRVHRAGASRAALAAAAAVALLIGTAPRPDAQIRWPSEGPPRPLPATPAQFPEYRLRTMPNGMQVIAVLHHEQPVVSMRMIVRAGGALDSKDKLGLANLAASLLTQGTTRQSASEMNESIDFIGGAMGAGAGTDFTFLNMVVMKDSFEAGLEMLSDMARRPAFAPEELERQRQQMLSGLQVSFDDPSFIADAVFRRLVYGFHPYAWPWTGTPSTLAAITRDDLAAFHKRYFVPNNTILAVVGDVAEAEAFAGVAKVFGDWERGELPPGTFTPPPDPTRRVVVINKPDAVQTEVRVGHVGVKRNHPDYMALNLALRILGGEGANRLHQVLRTERGLTYGAQADMDTLFDTGDFEASTNTRSDATGEVLRLIVDEFWRLQRERVNERELADAKAYMAGSFPLTIETPDAIATQVLNVIFYGLPVEQLQSFRERVNAVTPDDVQRVARAYLRPDRLSIVLVGNAAAFTPQLREIGFGTFETVEMTNLDLLSVNFRKAAALRAPAGPRLRRASYAPQANPATETNAARALLEKVIAAKGGLETLRAVKSIKAVTREEMTPPADRPAMRPRAADVTTYLEYPNRVRVETRVEGTRLLQVFDGPRGWVKEPNGTRTVPAEGIRAFEATLRRDVLALLLAAERGDVRTRLLPDVKDEEGERYRALEMSSPQMDPIVLQIDPESALIAKQTYVLPVPGQPLVEELFSDYKPVDGVQIAFRAEIRQAGARVLERRVTSIEINAPLDPELFRRPS